MFKYALFLLFVIGANSQIFTGKCGEEKTKIKACALPHNAGSDIKPLYQFLIFNKCGKGQKCVECEDDVYCCRSSFKLRKLGESCKYNEECITGLCNGDKCDAVSGDGECNSSKYCKPDFHCASVSTTAGTAYKCVKLLNEGEKADPTKGQYKCRAGLYFAENDKGERICVKMGTVDDDKVALDSAACKSGLLNEDGKCDTIKTAPSCTLSVVTGDWTKGGPMKEPCESQMDTSGNLKYYYPLYSPAKVKLFEELKKEYDDLDLEKINTQDKYFTTENGYTGSASSASDSLCKDNLKWKVYKKYLAYRNAVELQAAGLIDGEGEIVDDKDCEYNYIMKNLLSSGYTKIGALFLAFLALLF